MALMSQRRSIFNCAIVLATAVAWCSGARSAEPPAKSNSEKYTTEIVRGRVVWLDEALARRYGIAVEPPSAQTEVALETADGHLWPIVLDTRGRAFMVDKRLRGINVEMLVRRYADAPLIQVIRLFQRKADGLYEIDYWCDVCAIPMYILKPCECCQGPSRLREQKVEEPVTPGA